jgi:hypothetical protein
MIALLISIIALVLSLGCVWFIQRTIKSITTIIAPKLDEQDKRYDDLIKKLKKIL